MNNQEKLKACPFCGKHEQDEVKITDGEARFYVRCLWCGAVSGSANNSQDAEVLWNTRKESQNE